MAYKLSMLDCSSNYRSYMEECCRLQEDRTGKEATRMDVVKHVVEWFGERPRFWFCILGCFWAAQWCTFWRGAAARCEEKFGTRVVMLGILLPYTLGFLVMMVWGP